MVWARTKLTIAEDLFLPVKVLTVNYSGKDPQKFYGKINELLKKIFNVPEGYIQESDYSWDTKDDAVKFSVKWSLTKPMDKFTYLRIIVTLAGNAAGGSGKASIVIDPMMFTEYPQDSIWEQNLIYEIIRRFWDSVFYTKKREQYLDIGISLCGRFEKQLKQYAEELRHG